jgi:hypothetical protein
LAAEVSEEKYRLLGKLICGCFFAQAPEAGKTYGIDVASKV